MDLRERVEKFDEEHSKDGAKIQAPDQGLVLFPDGAQRELARSGIGCAFMAPPDDAFERARRTALYFRILMERATHTFEERKSVFQRIAANQVKAKRPGPPRIDAEEAKAELKKLRDAARKAQADYDKAIAGVEAARPDKAREKEAAFEQNREANARLLDSVQSVEL